jgi:hypothetical protein
MLKFWWDDYIVVVLAEDFERTVETVANVSPKADISPDTIIFDPKPTDTLFRLNRFEPVNHIPLAGRVPFLALHFSPSRMMRNICKRWGYVMGDPLGRSTKGILEPLQPTYQHGTTGLGYQESELDPLIRLLERKAKIRPSLSHFVSGGWIDPNQAAVGSTDKSEVSAIEQKKKQSITEPEDGLTLLFEKKLSLDFSYQNSDSQVMVLTTIKEEEEEDPTAAITLGPHPAEHNWYILDQQCGTSNYG